MDKKILGLYGPGMSYSDIQHHLKDSYDFAISDGTITAITDRLLPAIREWEHRTLESVYAVVCLDAIHFKVRHDGVVKTKAIYSILGVSPEGQKEVTGIYFGENEGASFWRSVLTDLKLRGVEDILIARIDNLKGFADAIEDLFPRTDVQLCLVHQMRELHEVYVLERPQTLRQRSEADLYSCQRRDGAALSGGSRKQVER